VGRSKNALRVFRVGGRSKRRAQRPLPEKISPLRSAILSTSPQGGGAPTPPNETGPPARRNRAEARAGSWFPRWVQPAACLRHRGHRARARFNLHGLGRWRTPGRHLQQGRRRR
jgi:hypothetical protein